jgi:hypothetical protein
MTIATQAPGRQWIVASESRPDTLYIVRRVNGQITCDCPGHYSHGHCKHADAVRTVQPLPAVDDAKVEMARRIGLMAS